MSQLRPTPTTLYIYIYIYIYIRTHTCTCTYTQRESEMITIGKIWKVDLPRNQCKLESGKIETLADFDPQKSFDISQQIAYSYQQEQHHGGAVQDSLQLSTRATPRRGRAR